METAADLLSRRDHATGELSRKLRQRGFTPQEVSDTLTKLEENGYLSDTRFAENYARELMEKRLLGNFGAVMKMRERGIDEDLARAAVEAASAGNPEYQRALEVLERKYRIVPDASDGKTVPKAAAMLKRKGFAAASIRRAIQTFFTATNDDIIIDDTDD